MGAIASQITSLTIVYSTVYSGVGNSPGTGEFPAQMASNAENVSIWWRHHVHWALKSLTHNHSTRAEPVWRHWAMANIRYRKWKGNGNVPKHCDFLKLHICEFWSPMKTLYSLKCNIIKLTSCNDSSQVQCIKWKTLSSPTPGVCSPLLALNVFTRAGQPLQHGEARDSNLALVGPVGIGIPI